MKLTHILITFLLLFVTTGCSSVKHDINYYKMLEDKRNMLSSKMVDNMQICLWGLKESDEQQRKEAFVKAAFALSAYPSHDEIQYATNLSFDGIKSLEQKNKKLTERHTTLKKKLNTAQMEIFHDSLELEGESSFMGLLKWAVSLLVLGLGVFILLRFGLNLF